MTLASRKAFSDYQKLVDKRKKKEEASSTVVDGRLITFKPNNTYRFRLLYYINDDVDRKEPFIEQRVHTAWDPETKTSGRVVCPTSGYISGKAGFGQCPVCNNNSKLWAEYQNGSESSREVYNKFKRKFYGYALVYVVKDSFNEENDGKVKIMRYGIKINDFLHKEILGEGEENEESDTIGSDAFDLESGNDLIITVGKSVSEAGTFNSYDCKFARKKSSTNVDPKILEKEITELDFDKDFYNKSTKEKLQSFFKEWVLDETESDSEETTEPPKEVETVDDVVLDNSDNKNEVSKEDPPKIEEKETTKSDDSDDYDLNDILKDIEKDFK